MAGEVRTTPLTERDLHGKTYSAPPTIVAARVKPDNGTSRRDQALDSEDKENVPRGVTLSEKYGSKEWRQNVQRRPEVQRRRKESTIGSRGKRNLEKKTLRPGSITEAWVARDQKTYPPSRDAIDEEYLHILTKGILIMVSQRLDIWIQSNKKAQKRLMNQEDEHNLHTKGGEQA